MKKPPPPRWRDTPLPPGELSDPQLVGRLFQRLEDPAALQPKAWRLRPALKASRHWHLSRSLAFASSAVVAGMLLVAASRWGIAGPQSVGLFPPPVPAAPSPPPLRLAGPARSAAPAPGVPWYSQPIDPVAQHPRVGRFVSSQRAGPLPHRAAAMPSREPPRDRRAPAAATLPPGAASAWDDEAALLAVALRQLRVGHDPASAIGSLNAYQQRFPRGALQREATLTRLDAEMARSHFGDALALLDQLHPEDHPAAARSLELTTLHAELLRDQGRCAEALHLLTPPVLRADDPRLAERAAHSLAGCLYQTGQLKEAQRVLEDVLRRFPEGPLAPVARVNLADLRNETDL